MISHSCSALLQVGKHSVHLHILHHIRTVSEVHIARALIFPAHAPRPSIIRIGKSPVKLLLTSCRAKVGLMFSCFYATSALRPITDLNALGGAWGREAANLFPLCQAHLPVPKERLGMDPRRMGLYYIRGR